MEINERLTSDHTEDYRRNIRCIFVSLFFSVSLSAVTLGPLFDTYLLNIGGKHGNKLVGAVESTRGFLQLICAYPIGALSDKMSRVRLLKMDLVFWTLGLALLIISILLDNLPLLFVGMALWAPCSQCWNSTSQVLVADSTTPASRTTVLSRMTTLRLVATATGPLLQSFMLLTSGQNHWGTSLLRAVILSGAILWPGVMSTLWMSDVSPLGKEEGLERNSLFATVDLQRRYLWIPTRWWLACTIEFTSLVTLFGAGMTVKFFPLFFRVDYKFTPMEVCLLSSVYPLATAVMVELCRRVSKRLGRLSAVAIFHFLGTACLWLLCYLRPLALVLPLYLLRGALMNARGPITRAIIMDLVPSDMRGRWNSIQSMSGFAWSGSAALGGYLADSAGDYRFTFVVTAGIYTVSFLGYLPLFLIYPEEHKAPAEAPCRPEPAASTRSLVASA